MSYRDTILALSPLAYWRLGDAGSTAADETGGFDLTYQGSPPAAGSLLAGDAANDARQFDGSAQYAAADYPNFAQTITQGSVVVWFQCSTLPGSINALLSYCEHDWYRRVIVNIASDGGIDLYTYNGVATNRVVTDTKGFNDGAPHCVVVTSTGGFWRVYVDGVEMTLSVLSGSNNGTWFGDLYGAASRLIIGGCYVNSSLVYQYSGVIDDVSIHPAVLSPAEISSIYLDGSSSQNAHGLTGNDTTAVATATISALSQQHALTGATAVAVADAPEGRLPSWLSAAALPMTLQGRISAQAVSIPLLLDGQLFDALVNIPVSLAGRISAPAVSVPITLAAIVNFSAASLPARLEGAADSHYLATHAKWSVEVVLDGADISDRLTGDVTIEHEENASGIAEFAMIPFAGPIALDDYENKQVVVRFEGRNSDGSLAYSSTRFTGTTSRATYNPDTGRLDVRATTDLQGRLESATRAEIDAIVGSGARWSEHVFDDTANGWRYAQDIAATAHKELHVTPYGNIAAVPIMAGTVRGVFTNDTRFSNALRIERVSRRDLVTRVTINFDFVFKRLRHRELRCNFVDSLGFCGFLNGAGSLPSKSVVQAAIDGNPWTRVSDVTFTELPGPGTYCTPPRGWQGNDKLCLGASWKAARRWVQTVKEEHTIVVVAPDVEEAVGEQPTSLDYAVEAAFDGSDFERITEFDGPPTGAAHSAATDDWQLDATNAVRTGRAEMEAAQECAIAYAQFLIADRARQNRVTLDVVYDPTVSLADTRRVDTPHLKATGKVAAIRETLGVDSGDTQMEVEIAVSRHGGSGLATTTPIAPSPAPQQPNEFPTSRFYYVGHRSGGVTGALPDNEDWDGWITNAYGGARTDPGNLYRERFVLKMPEIEKTARQTVTAGQATNYVFAVPQDELTLEY
ncbi:MAG: LamG domain-containing protein [Roseobacter sp.]|jgi:hypothetical protein|nr:LamG domain-containing protein [Roseobacter sp.]